MTSTFISVHYHNVFSTKRRQPFFDATSRERLHEYLGGKVNGLGGFPRALVVQMIMCIC